MELIKAGAVRPILRALAGARCRVLAAPGAAATTRRLSGPLALAATPLLCLPVLYLVKAAVLRRPLREGLRRYVEDARRDLLLKYWALWTPVQCLTFGVVPPQWRVPFIALVSFFWLLVLSSISSRGHHPRPSVASAGSDRESRHPS